jgi:hypothetical protein
MDRLAGMLEDYGRFGLDKNQMAALKEILQNRNPGASVTNQLITPDAYDDFFVGRGYVTPGIDPNMPKGLQEIKNTPGIEQSRQNLLNFLDKYRNKAKSTPTSSPQIPTPRSAPVAQATVPNRGGALVKNSGGALVDTAQRINTKTNVASGPRGMYTRLPSNGINVSANPNPTAGGTPFAGGVSSGVKSAAQTPAGRSVVKSVLNRSAPLVIGGLDAGVQISQGENPYVAGGRAFASALGGTLGSAGAMVVGGEGTPLDYLTMSGGYNEGSKFGTDLFNKGLNMFGYKRNTPSAQTTQQIKTTEQSSIPPNTQNMVPPAVTTTSNNSSDSSRPNKYPTIAEMQTIKPSRDYQKEQQEIERRAQGAGPRLDPNATEQYASNFKSGEANKVAMQDYFKGQKNGENLATWANQNPALAYKVYSKAMNKEKAADMAAYEEDYGSPMNQQSEQVFEQGKPDVITTSQFDVLNSPTELSAPTRAAYDLVMANDNPIANIGIPEGDIPQDFLSTQMKKYGLIK